MASCVTCGKNGAPIDVVVGPMKRYDGVSFCSVGCLVDMDRRAVDVIQSALDRLVEAPDAGEGGFFTFLGWGPPPAALLRVESGQADAPGDAPKAAEVLAHVDLFGVDDEREAAEIEVAALLAYGSSEGVAILPDGTLRALEPYTTALYRLRPAEVPQ